MQAVLGAILLFLIVGMIYPTPAHVKIKLNKRWKSFVAFLVVTAIGGAAFGTSTVNNTTTASSTDNTVKATATTNDTTAVKQTPAPKPTPKPVPKPKQWTKVIELTGDQSNSPSDRFQLTGGDVKMVWEITPDNEMAKDMVMMGGFLDDAGTNTDVDEFMANMGQKSGEWKVYGVPAGTYYFKPNTANGHWKATIYEMK